jgi:hypothetical protein
VCFACTRPSLRELACRYTDQERYFVSESSVDRLLKAAGLITSPAYVLMSASDSFKHPTARVHEMWQTDFTYSRIIGWGWYYLSLSTVLDDFSRRIVSWKLSATMGATDVMEMLDEVLAITGIDQVKVKHRPRLLSDARPAYLSGEPKGELMVVMSSTSSVAICCTQGSESLRRRGVKARFTMRRKRAYRGSSMTIIEPRYSSNCGGRSWIVKAPPPEHPVSGSRLTATTSA